MKNIDLGKSIFLLALGNISTFVINYLGGWTKDLHLLIMLMLTDMVMGVLIAIFWKRSNKSVSGTITSNAMWQGLSKKGITLFFVALGTQIDIMSGTGFIRETIIYAYCFNELISITEHAGVMGVPFPEQIKNAIEVLKNKGASK